MISSLNILIPVEYDIYPHVVDFYRTALKLAAHSNGISTKARCHFDHSHGSRSGAGRKQR